MKPEIFVGVDPGLTGAVAWIWVDEKDASLVLIEDMPTASAKVNGSTKSHLILPELARLLSEGPGTALGVPLTITVEQVSALPGQGVTSMFRFGQALGAVEGVAAGLSIPLSYIRPVEWQKLVSARKDPDAGRLRAAQLFPQASRYFKRKMDHNRADAALIAYAAACRARGRTMPTA